MLEISYIRENKEAVIQKLDNRFFSGSQEIVENIISLDEQRRSNQLELDQVLSEIKNISKQIGMLMKEGKVARTDKKKHISISD